MERDDPDPRTDGYVRRAGVPVPESFRARVDALVHWVLIGADRNLLTLLLEVAIFVVLVAAGTLRPFEMQTLLTETRGVQTLFNTLLSGIILLVSIVVSINSSVLSQQITSLGTQQERVEDTLEFRESLEAKSDAGVSPVRPRAFLGYILGTIGETATDLRGRVAESPDREFGAAATAYLDDVIERTDAVRGRLDEADGRPRDALFVGLEYDYSRRIFGARRLCNEYDDSLTDAEAEGFDELVNALQFFATGREYLKTLYIERELGTLSKTLLYVSLPAIVFVSYTLLAIDAGLFPTVTIPGVPRLLPYVSFAFVVALSPFIVLTSYVVRVVAVSERSLAAGPLVLGDGTDEDLPWE